MWMQPLPEDLVIADSRKTVLGSYVIRLVPAWSFCRIEFREPAPVKLPPDRVASSLPWRFEARAE